MKTDKGGDGGYTVFLTRILRSNGTVYGVPPDGLFS